MAADRIELSDDDFEVVVPFGFVVDGEGVIRVVGGALGRLLGVQRGQRVHDVFGVVRPWRTQSFTDLPVDPSATVVLRAAAEELELKGSTVAVDGGRRVAFLGSAVVRDIDEFQSRGLQLSDFPPSDATPDLLLSMQATRTALGDARKLSAELKVALADARAAMEAKARFLAMMSHEIRTPLNGFGSMIDLLRDSPLGDEQRENLETMDLCARSLLVLVNDILEFSKLEAGRIDIAPRPTCLLEAMTRIVDHFRATARERGLELVLRVDCPDKTWVSLDVERTRQVLANLIGNAIKFTDDGRVVVHVTVDDDDLLTVDVQDTGAGIPVECVRHLFEPFVQADSSATRRFGGTGLGLTISRQLAQAMGGDVRLVHSDPNGSWFRFTVPAKRCDAVAAASQKGLGVADAPGFTDAHVLVADDDGTNQLIATKLLKKLGIEATVVDDGREAVAAARAGHYDLILMDMMMPNLGGAEATEQIRAGDGPCRDVPIIAFSAAAFESDREAAAKAGMNGFIEKPARLDSLRAILRTHLPGRGAAGGCAGDDDDGA